MLRTAFLKVLDRLALPPEQRQSLVQWYDQREATEKFSGPFKIGNELTRFEDKTGLLKLAGLGSVGFGALEAAGLAGSGAAGSASAGGTAASIPTIPVDSTLFGEIPGAGASVAGAGTTGGAAAFIPEVPVDSTLFGETPGMGANLAPASGLPNLNWASLARGIPGLVGAFASNEQADSIRDIEARARADRAPFLNASKSYLADPNAYLAGPGKASLDAVLRQLSAVHGNPIGSPTAMGIATEAGLRDWRDAVLGFGNLGLAGEDTRANLALNATRADANVYNSLGGAAADIANPPKTLEEALRELNKGLRR